MGCPPSMRADYVRFGQVEDVDLFNVGSNSFHNQILDYRRSINMNEEYDEDDCSSPPPLPPPPFEPTVTADQVPIKMELDIEENTNVDEPYSTFVKEEPQSDAELDCTSNSFNNYSAPDLVGFSSQGEDGGEGFEDEENDGEESFEDVSERSCAENGALPFECGFNRRNKKIRDPPRQRKVDRRLIRLLEECPPIWNTCDPDYGNYSVTKKMWRNIAKHFPRKMNLKLRWKNLRRRFVRLEGNIRKGKRIYSFHDKSINFLLNRNLPKDKWIAVDKGENDKDDIDAEIDGNKHIIEDIGGIQLKENSDSEATETKDEKKAQCNGIEILEISDTDLKIIDFVETNRILWTKTKLEQRAEDVKLECKSLWSRLKEMFSDNVDVQGRWSDMYEMYKTFRLTNARSGSVLERLKIKQSKYLQKLHFLQAIDAETMVREYHIRTPSPIEEVHKEGIKLTIKKSDIVKNQECTVKAYNDRDRLEEKRTDDEEYEEVLETEDAEEGCVEADSAETGCAETDLTASESTEIDHIGSKSIEIDDNIAQKSPKKEIEDDYDSEEEHDDFQRLNDDSQFVLELVRVVRKYPDIWNSQHPDFETRSATANDLWQEIYEELMDFGRDIETIKSRWKLVEFNYMRLRREHLDYGYPDDEDYQSEALPFEELHFLDINL